jgi:hypothetical protein
MKALPRLVNGSLLLGLTCVAIGSVGCETRERVVVHDRPPVVQEHVRVVEPAPPVVQEKVIVRP